MVMEPAPCKLTRSADKPPRAACTCPDGYGASWCFRQPARAPGRFDRRFTPTWSWNNGGPVHGAQPTSFHRAARRQEAPVMPWGKHRRRQGPKKKMTRMTAVRSPPPDSRLRAAPFFGLGGPFGGRGGAVFRRRAPPDLDRPYFAVANYIRTCLGGGFGGGKVGGACGFANNRVHLAVVAGDRGGFGSAAASIGSAGRTSV